MNLQSANGENYLLMRVKGKCSVQMNLDGSLAPNELASFVADNFENFRAKEGSQHIATFSSQLNFLEKFCNLKSCSVLDFGSGIGTFIPIILNFSRASIVAVEKNEWCRKQFEKNVFEGRDNLQNRIRLAESIPSDLFDVVIIDDDICRKELSKMLCSKGLKFIFIEGWRNKTVGQISRRLTLYGYSASFFRGESRLKEFNRLGKSNRIEEKAGSGFILKRSGFWSNLKSWFCRLRETGELKEWVKQFYFWLGRSVRFRSRIEMLTRKKNLIN
jgi:hypothetical protein